MRQRIPWWNRQVLVHPIQRKYFFLSLVPLVFCAVLLVIVVFIPLRLAVAGLPGAAAPMPNPWLAYALAARIWPAFLLSMFATCLLSLLVTHRFAGPLYRIEQVLRRAAEGELPGPIQLRQRDDLHEFAAHLNRVFGAITLALEAIRAQEGEAGRELAALEDRIQAGLADPGEIVQRLEAIGLRHKEIANVVTAFRLPSGQAGDGLAEEAAPLRESPAALQGLHS